MHRLIADGMNPKKVAAQAGHTSVGTVFDVYGISTKTTTGPS
jgi:hypothetical protein